MSVREIRTIGDPVLRERARDLTTEELRSPAVQALIDDMVATKRAAQGAGLAANQVGEPVRIAVVEVEPDNPRYPFKPPFPLTVLVNAVLEPLGEEALINEGCLSVPGLRGEVPRQLAVRARYLDRDGVEHEQLVTGLTAGTFQHEVDHLDGVLFVDRADPRTLATWEHWERHQRQDFLARVAAIEQRAGARAPTCASLRGWAANAPRRRSSSRSRVSGSPASSHSEDVRPPERWQRFRFGSGLLRMGGARLERAPACKARAAAAICCRLSLSRLTSDELHISAAFRCRLSLPTCFHMVAAAGLPVAYRRRRAARRCGRGSLLA